MYLIYNFWFKDYCTWIIFFLPLWKNFYSTWGSVCNSAIFNSFHNQVEFGTILEGLQDFGGGGWNPPPQTPPRYTT